MAYNIYLKRTCIDDSLTKINSFLENMSLLNYVKRIKNIFQIFRYFFTNTAETPRLRQWRYITSYDVCTFYIFSFKLGSSNREI